ncbi:MAG: glycosyltransferase family 4 protein [Thermodesulfobacteriota bacterium]
MLKAEDIIMIIPNAKEPRCGGDFYFCEIIKYFENNDCKPLIIDFNNVPEKVKRLKIICNLWLFFYLIRKKGKIVIQDGYFRDYLFFCNILLKIFANLRIVLFFQDFRRFNVSGSSLRRIKSTVVLRLFLRTADIVIGNSEYLRREVISEKYPEDRVFSIPPSYQKLTSATDKKKNNKNEQILLLCVGNYREIKGQKYLIEAMKIINNPQVILYLVGSPERDYPYYLSLKDQIRRNNIENHVFFTGWLKGDELAQMYLSADILVLPSLYEAFGMVLLEAMSCELPVIASNIGGIPEIVKDGENGFLTPPSDPACLASALQKLIKSRELRSSLGKRGKEMIQSFPSWEAVCLKFYTIINGSTE